MQKVSQASDIPGAGGAAYDAVEKSITNSRKGGQAHRLGRRERGLGRKKSRLRSKKGEMRSKKVKTRGGKRRKV